MRKSHSPSKDRIFFGLPDRLASSRDVYRSKVALAGKRLISVISGLVHERHPPGASISAGEFFLFRIRLADGLLGNA